MRVYLGNEHISQANMNIIQNIDGVDTSKDTVTADTLVEGVSAHDKNGNHIVGTNPYAKAATDSTVNTQADLIAQIQTALEGKAGGGGKNTVTIAVTMRDTSSYKYHDADGNVVTSNSSGTIEALGGYLYAAGYITSYTNAVSAYGTDNNGYTRAIIALNDGAIVWCGMGSGGSND